MGNDSATNLSSTPKKVKSTLHHAISLKRKILFLRVMQGLDIASVVAMTVTSLYLSRLTGAWQYLGVIPCAGIMAWFIVTPINMWIEEQRSPNSIPNQ